MSYLLYLALLSPLVAFVPRRAKVWFSLALVAAGAAIALAVALPVLSGGEAAQWSYRTLRGVETARMDALSAIFAVIISLGGVAVTLYSRGYLRAHSPEAARAHLSLHYTALPVMFFAMLGVVVCRGAYGFLLCWELMTIASFVLILFDAGRQATRRAALSYLVMMHVGFVLLLSAFVTVAAKGLPASFDSLAFYFALYKPLPLFLLFVAGFGMKAGMFPLHTWLPEAHPAAPSHVSAFMSGVMIKMGVYGIVRVCSFMHAELLTAGIVLFAAGVVTGVWGALLAAVQNDIKRLLAYSSIENIGIIILAVGAAMIGRAMNDSLLPLCAMAGALMHALNHSLFKTLLFMGAGNIQTAVHTTAIERLGGVAKRMPATAALFLTATVAICALPPLNGFVSEFMIYYGFFDVLPDGWQAILGAAGILSLSFIGGVVFIAFTKLYGVVFLGNARTPIVEHAREVDALRLAAMGIPALGIVATGLFPFAFMRGFISAAGEVTGAVATGTAWRFISGDVFSISVVAGLFVGFTLLLYFIKRAVLRRRPQGVSPTWGCGYGAPTGRMQYTGESYAEGLQSVAPALSGTQAGDAAPGEEDIFPDGRTFGIRRADRIASLIGQWWVELLRVVNGRVMRMRTGKVNNYILYALLFLLLVLLLSLFSLI